MANTIRIKRSGTASNTPSVLEHGELALNYADGKLFYKDANNVIQQLNLPGATGPVGPTGAVGATGPAGPTGPSGPTGPASEALKLNALTFNGVTTTFALLSGATDVYPASAAALIISLNGVVQEPVTDYTVSGNNITFSQAPAADAAFFGVSLNGIAAPITAASITSGTLDPARLPLATTGAAGAIIVGTGLGVSSGTASVTYGTTSGTACQGNDSRLSDTRTPTDGSVTTAKLADDSVTYAKLQNVSATDRLLGRSSAGAGDVEEITCPAFGRSLISSADASAARTTLSVQPTASPAFTGTATFQAVTIVDAVAGGQLLVNDNSSDSTNRFGTLGTSHYTLSEEPIQAMGITATSTENVVYIGGGYSQFNTATSIIFHTAANNTTTTGTARLTISSTGTATFAGQIVGQAGAVLTGTVAGNVRQLRMQTSGSTRWEVGPGFDAESGSNVGSTFWITRWSDAGSFLGTPLSISRATGVVSFESGIAASGAATFDNTGNVVPLTVTNTGTENSFVVNDASGDSTPFVVDASGRVGVGVSSPTHTLDCNGEFRLRGTGPSAEAGKLHLYWVSDTNRATITTGSSGQIIVETGFPTVATRLTISSTGTATFAGQVLVTAGSGSSGSYKPGMAISGDDDTGVQQVGGANTLSVVTGGTERVRVDASGYLGVGTTNPQRRLHVSNDGAEGLEFFVGVLSGESRINAFNRSSSAWNKFSVGCSTLEFFVGSGATSALIIGSTGTISAAQVYSDTVGATNRDLFVDSTGKFGYVSSIRESKTDIVTLDDVSWLSALSPVSYRYRKRNADGTYSDEADGVTDYGLIAEDVEAVRPELCFYDMVDGEPQLRGVTYSKLIAPMLRYIQQLEARIAALEEILNHA